MIRSRRELVLGVVFVLATACNMTRAQNATANLKGTVSATDGSPSVRPELLPGASVNLINRDLTTSTFKTISDGTGNFAFHRSEEHTSELQSHHDLVCRLLLEKK